MANPYINDKINLKIPSFEENETIFRIYSVRLLCLKLLCTFTVTLILIHKS